jgi:hypothetical protein
MSIRIILSTLLASFILSACQVKESESSGGLISGHSPTTNKFTVTGPAADNYVTNDVISFQVKFPFNLAVTGTPRLRLMVGATTRYADYVSGDGASTLHFSYTVVGADNDADGVALQALELNGGTLKFTSNGVVADANITTVAAATYATALIDNTVPTVSSLGFSPTTIANYYPNGSTVSFTATFSEPVYVTGAPQMAVTLSTGGLRNPSYAGGSGTTSLVFSYTVTQADFDKDGYVFGPAILLPTGTIKDAAGNDATLTYNAATVTTDSATRDIDGRLPHILSVTPPANGTYLAAQNLDVTVEFDRAVNVSTVVAPFINLTIGSNTRQAAYYSGTGTNTIVFRYTTIPGDVAPSGIVIAPTINNNTTATINGVAETCTSNVAGVANTNCFYGDVRNTVFIPPVTTGVIINSVQPQAISVNRGVDTTLPTWGAAVADSVWIIGQDLLITVGFNTNVFVDQGGGTPRIPLTLTSGTVYATYLSGGDGQTSLVFKYTVQADDLAMTGAGITLGTLDLNGGTITNSSNTNSLTTLPAPSWVTTRIDGVRPIINTVAKPAAGTYSLTNLMNYTVTWSEAVRYTATNAVSFPVNIGGTTRQALYVSGDQTATIIHRPSVATLTDTDGVIVTSPAVATNTVTDLPGNTATDFTFTPPVTTDILVDTTAPTVLSVNLPTAGTYKVGDNLDFTVNFNEVVNVTTSGGYPRIPLVMNSTRYATYQSGSGSTSIVFRYTVVGGDYDLSITNPTSIAVNIPAYIRDIALNSTTTYAITTDLTGIIVDGQGPIISSRTFPSNGTYQDGDVLQFTTTFDEAVDVTGTPRIQVTAQTGTLNFDYVSGTGTTTLTFEYTVTANDFDFDGMGSITSIALNSGTIQDVSTNNATLTFTAVSLASVYIAFPNTVVWSVSPFANRSPIAGLSVTTSGAVSTQACGTSTCRTFDGDDTFGISAGITGAEEVFIVFKAPGVASNVDLLSTDLSLVIDTTVMDMASTGTTIFNLNGSVMGGSPNYDTNLAVSSTNILHARFTTPPNYGAGPLINTSYAGAIGDVIIINSALSAAQRSAILTYLNTKY